MRLGVSNGKNFFFLSHAVSSTCYCFVFFFFSPRKTSYAPISFLASQNSTVWMDFAFEEHLCGFKLFPITNDGTINTCMQEKDGHIYV